MKRNSFNVLFFIKKAKLLKNGESSVCMRITVNGARVETNIRKSIDPASWNQAKECARGKSRKSCDLNAYIEDAKIRLHQIFNELEEQRQPITARLLQEKFFGQDKEPEEVRTLIGTMQEHNDQCRALVGKDYALITVRRYESCKRYLAELIKQKYEKDDLPLTEVNGELVRAFEFYLKTEKSCQQNTVIRYMKCLKKITNLALANEWITKDPFVGIKFHEKEVVREFLTMDELLTIYHKAFHWNVSESCAMSSSLQRSLGWRSLMYSNFLPNTSWKMRMATSGFARHGKRQRTCAISLCLTFLWKFSVSMPTIPFAKRKGYCCLFPAIRR